MTEKQFYDWQTLGGTDEVMRFVSEKFKDEIWSIARRGDESILRVATLESTLQDHVNAFADRKRPQSKRLTNLAKIARLVESHPELWEKLPDNLRAEIERP